MNVPVNFDCGIRVYKNPGGSSTVFGHDNLLPSWASDSTFSGMSNKELKEDPQYFSVQSEREVTKCKFPGAQRNTCCFRKLFSKKTKIPACLGSCAGEWSTSSGARYRWVPSGMAH